MKPLLQPTNPQVPRRGMERRTTVGKERKRKGDRKVEEDSKERRIED